MVKDSKWTNCKGFFAGSGVATHAGRLLFVLRGFFGEFVNFPLDTGITVTKYYWYGSKQQVFNGLRDDPPCVSQAGNDIDGIGEVSRDQPCGNSELLIKLREAGLISCQSGKSRRMPGGQNAEQHFLIRYLSRRGKQQSILDSGDACE